MRELNKLVNKMLGKSMTKKEKRLLESLRKKVKAKEITIEEAHEIWNSFPRNLSEVMKAMRIPRKKGKIRRWKVEQK